jgi:hypothetical protein
MTVSVYCSREGGDLGGRGSKSKTTVCRLSDAFAVDTAADVSACYAKVALKSMQYNSAGSTIPGLSRVRVYLLKVKF